MKVITTPQESLTTIFQQMDAVQRPAFAKCQLTNINNTIEYYEKHLKSLQNLKDCLPHIAVVSKANVLGVMKRVRSIYADLDVWQEISDYWLEVRSGLNNVNIEFNGSVMVSNLLLNKSIIVLNRTIFAATRTRENLINLGVLKVTK